MMVVNSYLRAYGLNKGNVSPLLNGLGILVTADTDKAFLVLAFTVSVSQASVLEGMVQGGEEEDKD